MDTCDMQTLELELVHERDRVNYCSPDYVPTDIAHLALPAPRPAAEADRVYAVFASKGELLGVLTSPVDAAEVVKKLGDDAFKQTCVLNAI